MCPDIDDLLQWLCCLILQVRILELGEGKCYDWWEVAKVGGHQNQVRTGASNDLPPCHLPQVSPEPGVLTQGTCPIDLKPVALTGTVLHLTVYRSVQRVTIKHWPNYTSLGGRNTRPELLEV